MKMRLLYIGGVVVALVLGVMWFQGWSPAREAEWEADKARVLADAEVVRERADSAMSEVARHEAGARASASRADSLERRAAMFSSMAARIRYRIDTVRVPVAALPYTAPRDSLIVVLGHQVDTLGAALNAQRLAYVSLQAANTVLRVTTAELMTTVDSLSSVLKRHPKARAWWVPTVTLGVGGGMDALDRKAYIGPGAQLGWKIGIL